jgi:hypothetical protein
MQIEFVTFFGLILTCEQTQTSTIVSTQASQTLEKRQKYAVPSQFYNHSTKSNECL